MAEHSDFKSILEILRSAPSVGSWVRYHATPGGTSDIPFDAAVRPDDGSWHSQEEAERYARRPCFIAEVTLCSVAGRVVGWTTGVLHFLEP